MHFPNGSALLSQSGTTLLRNNTPSLTLPAFETQELGWENYLVRVVAAIGLTFLARWMYQSARSRWGPVNHINAHDDDIELANLAEAIVGIPPDGLGNGEQANISIAIDRPMHNGPRPACQV